MKTFFPYRSRPSVLFLITSLWAATLTIGHETARNDVSLNAVSAPQTGGPVRPHRDMHDPTTTSTLTAPVTTVSSWTTTTRAGRNRTGTTTTIQASERRIVSSTAYAPGCGASGLTASGKMPYIGSAAMNGVPFGSRWRVVQTGAVYTVEDRIGHGSGFDIYMSSCAAARQYGRRTITIERVS